MENYFLSMHLLGVRDQNMPIFKEARYQRLASIEKMNKLVTILPRLIPKFPSHTFTLDKRDQEWDDGMIYPKVHYHKYIFQASYWLILTGFYCYNWNVILANKRLRHMKNFYPALSLLFLGDMYFNYSSEIYKVDLFENYCKVRAKELFEEKKYLLDHPHFERFVYFNEDMKETMGKIHRQANNHNSADFKDSEVILQDFIRRHSDPENPDADIFRADGKVKLYN